MKVTEDISTKEDWITKKCRDPGFTRLIIEDNVRLNQIIDRQHDEIYRVLDRLLTINDPGSILLGAIGDLRAALKLE